MGGKDLFGSVSFWGPLLMAANMLGGIFGFDVGALIGDPGETANALATVAALVIGVLGILKRKTTISSVAGVSNPLAPK